MPEDGHTRLTIGDDVSSPGTGKEASVAQALWDDEDTKKVFMNVYLISGHLFLLCYWEKQSKKGMISDQKHQINQDSTTPESDQGQIAARDTAETSVMFYGLAVVTFGTAVPAGQFVPSIMIGSTYGHLVGMFVVRLYEKVNIEKGMHSLSDFVKPVSSKGLSISDIHLTPDDLEALKETRLKQK
ncbi:unnamed protein product [Lactuca saligna]|uniref:Uncharacterized protein n=1 Tax=Lactuca saligna TaxID=75948 RepID=A0AA35Z2B8_LACSI|nr:unnamed protein product [Lactuca saligna]